MRFNDNMYNIETKEKQASFTNLVDVCSKTDDGTSDEGTKNKNALSFYALMWTTDFDATNNDAPANSKNLRTADVESAV